MIVKNLTIQNLYVHNSVSDAVIDPSSCGGVYANGYGSLTIQDCTFSNVGWCITAFGSPGGLLTVTRCSFSNYDHGIGGVATLSSGTVAGFSATYNHFGTTANWDTTANVYHHDGIHTFWGNGSGGIPNAVITNNLFDGDWGINNTSHLFFEQNFNTHNPAEAPGWLIANNVHIQNAGNLLNNGFMIAICSGATVANNTYIGSSVPLSLGVGLSVGTIFKNNIVSGVNRFVSSTSFAASGLNNNIYANAVGSGNSPFALNGTSFANFAAWQVGTGQDAASSQIASAGITSTGTLQAGSAAIGAGLDLSSVFTVDYAGSVRTVPWDIGAYKNAAGNIAPTITLSPVTQSVTTGANVTFAATATGTPTPTWQWNKNASPIGGATSASLVLLAVTSGDNGSYTATATNAAGSATSAAAVLTVTTPPPANGTPGTPVITGIIP